MHMELYGGWNIRSRGSQWPIVGVHVEAHT